MKPTFDKKRPLSWSAISSFEWNPEQWYNKYVLKQEEPASKEMIYGSTVGTLLATERKYLPEVPRLSQFEHKLTAKFGKIPLIGFVDSYEPVGLEMLEYKTGKKEWTQKRADEHGQIDMYLLMFYLRDKIKPENFDCKLVWLPTEESLLSMDDTDSSIHFRHPFEMHIFETKRTMTDILKFGQRINRTYKSMEAYCENHEAPVHKIGAR